MGYLQQLNDKQISKALVGATQKQIPVTLTVRSSDSWHNLRSRFLAIRGANLIFETPSSQDGSQQYEFSPSEKVGISFKYKHYKHTFSTIIMEVGQDISLSNGTNASAISTGCPINMERLQRRAFYRALVPPGKIVRVAFWIGGQSSEPSGTSPETPVWTGQLCDISAGGFQAKVADDVTMAVDVGDTVGLRITFGAGEEVIFADAQYRHLGESENGRTLMGFQFLGLGHTPESKNALRLISEKVSEYQRIEIKTRSNA